MQTTNCALFLSLLYDLMLVYNISVYFACQRKLAVLSASRSLKRLVDSHSMSIKLIDRSKNYVRLSGLLSLD